jgi:hypothetical protein
MKDQLISFKTAKLAKDAGFQGIYPTTDYIPMYIREGELSEQQGEDDERGDFYLAVSQSLLQSWMREKLNRIVLVVPFISDWDDPDIEMDEIENKTEWSYFIWDWVTGKFLSDDVSFSSYEEALEMGLQEGLRLIKP